MSDQSGTIILRDKVIVGVTGNIATGKSAVMRLAGDNEALTIDADKIVHDIMDRDTNMQAAIAVAFGPEVRLPNGRINRRALGKIVFNDESALVDLEQIVHPAVRLDVVRQIQETDRPIIFVEAIKLLEGPMAAMCHQIWVTRCPKQRQLERLTICRGMDAGTATRRIELQPPQEEKVAQADVVVDTAGLMRETEMQFELAWARLPQPETAAPVKLVLPASPETAALPAQETTKPGQKTASSTPAATRRPIPTALKEKLGKKIDKAAVPEPADSVPDKVEPPAPADNVEVRRARPSDIPSIMLLIHKATGGTVKLKRAEMLMAFSERSYFIGQVGPDIQAVVGWNIENLVSTIDQFYFHPIESTPTVGSSILHSIEQSADRHICEIIVAFFPPGTPESLRQLFTNHGFGQEALEKMPVAWRMAIRESQPDDETDFVIKVLRERVTHPM